LESSCRRQSTRSHYMNQYILFFFYSNVWFGAWQPQTPSIWCTCILITMYAVRVTLMSDGIIYLCVIRGTYRIKGCILHWITWIIIKTTTPIQINCPCIKMWSTIAICRVITNVDFFFTLYVIFYFKWVTDERWFQDFVELSPEMI